MVFAYPLRAGVLADPLPMGLEPASALGTCSASYCDAHDGVGPCCRLCRACRWCALRFLSQLWATRLRDHLEAGRMSGQDFVPQPDGTLRCLADHPLYPQERRPEHDGTVRVVYAARIGHCRPCPLRERCQWHGAQTSKPRRVSAVLHPLTAPTPPLNEPPQARLAVHPILWGDWERCSHRREFVKLLRHQRVDVRLAETSPSALPARPLSRAERAHWRLSWAERLARNAVPSASPAVSITLFGVPDAFARSIGLQTL